MMSLIAHILNKYIHGYKALVQEIQTSFMCLNFILQYQFPEPNAFIGNATIYASQHPQQTYIRTISSAHTANSPATSVPYQRNVIKLLQVVSQTVQLEANVVQSRETA